MHTGGASCREREKTACRNSVGGVQLRACQVSITACSSPWSSPHPAPPPSPRPPHLDGETRLPPVNGPAEVVPTQQSLAYCPAAQQRRGEVQGQQRTAQRRGVRVSQGGEGGREGAGTAEGRYRDSSALSRGEGGKGIGRTRRALCVVRGPKKGLTPHSRSTIPAKNTQPCPKRQPPK